MIFQSVKEATLKLLGDAIVSGMYFNFLLLVEEEPGFSDRKIILTEVEKRSNAKKERLKKDRTLKFTFSKKMYILRINRLHTFASKILFY